MAKPQNHIFVCGQTRPDNHPRGSCGQQGADNVYQRFAMALTQKNLLSKAALNRTGCLGPCHLGTNVLVYPEGIMYTAITEADVERIVDEHLIGGTAVADKLAPEEIWS